VACRYDTIVTGGGGGTLNELVAALLKHDAPCHISIAQLPLGTTNDLASAAGISLVSSRSISGISISSISVSSSSCTSSAAEA
jgi:diacylglycerol kinase family enzyme